MHRTLLFLLVVGLIIEAFRRGLGTGLPDTRKTADPAVSTPASSPSVRTNAAGNGAMAASDPGAHK